MKITKTSIEYSRKQMLKEIALNGCNTCPCCGETKTTAEYLKEGVVDKGMYHCLYHEQWFGKKNDRKHPILSLFTPPWGCDCWQVDHFRCQTCGAEWESDPYRI